MDCQEFRPHLYSSIVVFQAFNVVFSEVIAPLNFDKNKVVLGVRILDSVGRALGDIHRLTGLEGNLFVVQGNNGLSLNYVPVF